MSPNIRIKSIRCINHSLTQTIQQNSQLTDQHLENFSNDIDTSVQSISNKKVQILPTKKLHTHTNSHKPHEQPHPSPTPQPSGAQSASSPMSTTSDKSSISEPIDPSESEHDESEYMVESTITNNCEKSDFEIELAKIFDEYAQSAEDQQKNMILFINYQEDEKDNGGEKNATGVNPVGTNPAAMA